MNKIIVVILGAVALLVLVVFFVTKPTTPSTPPSPEPSSASSELEPNYTDPDFGYEIYIPNSMTSEKQSDYSKLFYPKEQPLGAGPTNFIYVSVVTPDKRDALGDVYNYNAEQFNKLIALTNIGDSVNLASGDVPDLGDWFTYTLVDEVSFNSGRAKVFENTRPWEFPAGTTETRFIFDSNENVYLLGYYSGGDSGATLDPREAYKSILSFKVN